MRQLFNPKGQSPAYTVPCWLSQVPVKQLSDGAKILYARLTQWADSEGHAFRSAIQLAPELGIGYRAVEKRIQELKSAGLIGTYHPQAGGLNHFEFYVHEWMSAPTHKNLSYKSDPPHDHVVPPTRSCGTPPHDHVAINRSNKNKEKEICVLDEIITHEADHCEPNGSLPTKYLSLKPYIEIWNEIAVKEGCPRMGVDKRHLASIKKNLKEINIKWENELSPETFRIWLANAIVTKQFMIHKFKNRMEVCVRPHHFLDIYNQVKEVQNA